MFEAPAFVTANALIVIVDASISTVPVVVIFEFCVNSVFAMIDKLPAFVIALLLLFAPNILHKEQDSLDL